MSNLLDTGGVPAKQTDAIEYFSGKFYDALAAVPPELLTKSEVELIEEIKPTRVDWFLRHRFWELVDEAREAGAEKIPVGRMFKGICSEHNFYINWMPNPKKLEWTLFPIKDEKEYAQEAYHYAMLKIRKFVLESNITADNAGDFVKLAKFLSDRGFGPVTQKVEAKMLSAKVDLNKPQLSADEIKRKIAELETTKEAPVIDVTPE